MASEVPTSNDHLLAFGSIIQNFARFERIIEICISKILLADHALTAVAISNLGYSAKCETLKSLLSLNSWPDLDRSKTVLEFVTKFNSYVPLRNAIAHHVWKQGKRLGSIKPLSASARGGKAKFQGLFEDEKDYTVDDLFEISNDLGDIHDRFVKFLIDVGAIKAIER
jgi:hypothetical protein